MNAGPRPLITATKILSATILTGVGAAGLYGDFYPASVRTRVAAALLTLGLWLLVSAWTGRSVLEHFRSFYFSTSNLGVSVPNPHEERT